MSAHTSMEEWLARAVDLLSAFNGSENSPMLSLPFLQDAPVLTDKYSRTRVSETKDLFVNRLPPRPFDWLDAESP